MTSMNSTATPIMTTAEQVGRSLAFTARRLALPLLGFGGSWVLIALVAYLLLRWQGVETPGPGTSSDGVWLGVEVSADRVVVRGLDWIGVIAVGFVAFGLSAALPGMLFGRLVAMGVTRRAVAVTGLLAVLAMFALVVAVVPVSALLSADSVAAWSRTLASSGGGLVALGVLMLGALALATAWLHGPWWGALATLTPVLLVTAGAILGVLPSGPVMAVIVSTVSVLTYLALVLRFPVR
ncbi:MAG: hypothetical protein Q4G43_10130 [Mobilicoccus sp.]|nr:hypothetical protein [Mobilicoccus sp.]